MKNSFGQSVIVTLFGESHGAAIGAVVDGLAPGIPVDEAFIARQLTLRRPAGATGTARREADRFIVLSGVYRGKTTGTPLCITYDFDSQQDGCVTVRDRDTMEQVRIKIEELDEYIGKRIVF